MTPNSSQASRVTAAHVKSRRTQDDRSRGTRTAVLEAAIRCLIEVGYAGTSTTAITLRAGVSRGALTHQFPSKQELMVAAIRHLADVRTAALSERLGGEGDGPVSLRETLRVFWEDGFDTDLFLAALELWTASRTDGVLREVLHDCEPSIGQLSRERLAPALGPDIAEHPRLRTAWAVMMRQMRGEVLTNLIRRERRDTDEFIAQCERAFRAELDADPAQ